MKIYVVTHKPFEQPKSPIYKVIKVGSGCFEMDDSESDSTGDNISTLNYKYCELTALYWIWKNSKEKIVGLNHYRRFFSINGQILQESVLNKLMVSYDIIIPKKRNYYIFTIDKHYEKAHYKKDLDILKRVIQENYPEYVESFDIVMKGTTLSLYNMFVMRKELLNEYSEFLFSVLDMVDKRIDTKNYDPYQRRVIGFLAERVFNVWVMENKNKLKIKYLKVKNTEGESIAKKGFNLIKRHFFKW